MIAIHRRIDVGAAKKRRELSNISNHTTVSARILDFSFLQTFSSGTVVLPASSSIRSNSKPVSIQTIVPKITAIPLSSTCSMDISPSHSNGSLVSMDESMSTFDIVRSPEVEYIDDRESAAVDSIEKKA
uniref:Cyclin A1 n=1 Tax=Solanum tuberosum TaxID=4113 RepID=M1DM19_SOLTU